MTSGLRLFLSLLLCSRVFAQFTTTRLPSQSLSYVERAAAASSTFTVETLTADLLATNSLHLAPGPSASPIQASDLTIQTGVVINNFSTDYNAVCWYPVSGSYATLPRILFYTTLVFALVGRTHEWLIAGALTAALTFSGVAAIHAVLLLWVGPGYGELDLFALEGILSTACLLAIPLINWSSTLRYLGRPKPEDSKGKREPGNTRTVVIWWSFLVAIGFLATFVGIEYGGANSWIRTPLSVFTISALDQLQCFPPNGVINQAAGQRDGWTYFWITTEFIAQNNCMEPCSTSLGDGLGTIFRSPGDLQSLTVDQINRNFEFTGLNSKEINANHFQEFYHKYALFAVPYFICQAVWAVFNGRRSPQQARSAFYRYLAKIKLPRKHESLIAHNKPKVLAQIISELAFIWAVLILFLCPPVFILNIIATEFTMHTLPQSESNTHIGQWQPWASTVLVLIAALIARFHKNFKEFVIEIINVIFWGIGVAWSGRFGDSDYDVAKHKNKWRYCGADTSENLGKKPRMLRKENFVQNYKQHARDHSKHLWELFVWTLGEIPSKFKWEWESLIKFSRHPGDNPDSREREDKKPECRWCEDRMKNEKRKSRKHLSGYNPVAPGKNVDDGATTPSGDDSREYTFSTGDPSKRDEEREAVRLHPGYLPGSAGLKRLMKSIGLGDPSLENRPREHEDVPYQHHQSEPAALPTQENPIQSIPLAVMADRRRHRSMAAVPRALSSASQPEIRPLSMHNLPEMVTPEEEEEEDEDDIHDEKSTTRVHEREMEIEQMHPAWRASSHKRRRSLPASSVSASLNDSMAQRQRRSQLYSPEPLASVQEASGSHENISSARPSQDSQPRRSADSLPQTRQEKQKTRQHTIPRRPAPPPPPPNLSSPSLGTAALPSYPMYYANPPLEHSDSSLPMPISSLTTSPAASPPTSHLFSPAELAAVFAHGTPPLLSTTSLSSPDYNGSRISYLDPTAGAATGYAGRGRVSYLQVQTPPDGAELGEELALRWEAGVGWRVVGRNGDMPSRRSTMRCKRCGAKETATGDEERGFGGGLKRSVAVGRRKGSREEQRRGSEEGVGPSGIGRIGGVGGEDAGSQGRGGKGSQRGVGGRVSL